MIIVPYKGRKLSEWGMVEGRERLFTANHFDV